MKLKSWDVQYQITGRKHYPDSFDFEYHLNCKSDGLISELAKVRIAYNILILNHEFFSDYDKEYHQIHQDLVYLPEFVLHLNP